MFFCKMQRPGLLVPLLLMIFLTSWIELKLNEVEATATLLYKSSDPQQSLKEKIILSQEKSIQKLKELVQDLQKQLEICRVKTGNSVNDTTIQLTEFLNSIEHEWK